MEIGYKSQNKNQCKCSEIPGILHELAQSALIIHAYASGCSERIKVNELDNSQLSEILKKINKHTEIIGDKIHHIKWDGIPLSL